MMEQPEIKEQWTVIFIDNEGGIQTSYITGRKNLKEIVNDFGERVEYKIAKGIVGLCDPEGVGLKKKSYYV
jgi:hypothetical protein